MNDFVLCDALRRKQPLIYRIPGGFFFIGSGVFQKCTQDEVNLYEELINAYNKLCKDCADLSKLCLQDRKIVLEICDVFQKIRKKYMYADGVATKKEADSKIAELICSLNDREKASLEEQIETYKTIDNLNDECYYRESEEYKQ